MGRERRWNPLKEDKSRPLKAISRAIKRAASKLRTFMF